MTSSIISRLAVICAIALMGFGCKSATAPNTIEKVVIIDTHTPGEFGLNYNGTTIDRKDYPDTLSYASASILRNNGSAGFILVVDLYFNLSSPTLAQTLEMRIPMQAPIPGTFTTTGGMNGTWAGLRVDTAFYVSVAGGQIVITKFDTINNVISGTFSFDGVDNILSEHVTGGYFSQVPIYYGLFNQSPITADILNNFVNDTFKSAGTFPAPTLYTVDSGKTFMIIAHDDDAQTQREIRIGLTNIGVGSTDLNPSSGAQVFGEYRAFGVKRGDFSTTGAGTGNITITKFDWKTHRMSATFNLAGNNINITNGKMDNLLWSEL